MANSPAKPVTNEPAEPDDEWCAELLECCAELLEWCAELLEW